MMCCSSSLRPLTPEEARGVHVFSSLCVPLCYNVRAVIVKT